MIVLIVIGVVAVASIAAAVIDTARDGYGRVPERNLVRIF